MAATVVGSTFAAQQFGLPSGRAVLRKYPMFAVPAIFGTWFVTYEFWSYTSGWSGRAQNEYLYGKNIRTLRNIQIKE